MNNISSLITGFKLYLEDLSEISNKPYAASDSDVSIFMYANEFKNYLSDELDIDPKILSMSINDILDMDIENGKLVDPDDEEDDETVSSDPDTSPQTSESTDTLPSEDDSTSITNDENSLSDSAQIPLNQENQQNSIGNDSVSDLLNNLFVDDTFKNIIDLDKNGELNEEEIYSFLDAIKGFDGDDQNISLEDILSAIKTIKDNLLSSDNQLENNLDENQEVDDLQEAQSAPSSSAASAPSGVSGSSGSFSPSAVSSSQQQGTQEKTLDNMSKEELNSELNSAQADLSDKQNTLSAILDGSDSQIAKLQQNIDDSYDTYLEQLENVDEDLAEQVDNLKTDIDSKEDEIDSKEQEISDQESTVSDSETAYNNAVSSRKNLENILSTLKSMDTSDMDSDKKAELSSRISTVQTQLDNAKKKEEETKTAWDEAEDKLKQLNDEKDSLQADLDELNEQMTALEEEITQKYPEIQQYLDAYNTAKDEYDSYKQEAISNAKADIQESQNYVNEVQTAINNFDNKETIKEYCFNDFGEDIIEFASSFIGNNEGDGSADKFLGGENSSEIPWCAAFVEYVMENFGDYEDVPDWYKNIENKWWCPNIYQAASDAGAIINGNEVQTGDIVLFDWDGDGVKDHIGIVKVAENGQVITIEGNTSNQVAEKSYDINDSRLTFCKVVS